MRNIKVISQESVWIDPLTSLTWEVFYNEEPVSYGEALAFAEKANKDSLYGFTDWRIPRKEDILSLLNKTGATNNTHLKIHALKNVYGSEDSFWFQSESEDKYCSFSYRCQVNGSKTRKIREGDQIKVKLVRGDLIKNRSFSSTKKASDFIDESKIDKRWSYKVFDKTINDLNEIRQGVGDSIELILRKDQPLESYIDPLVDLCRAGAFNLSSKMEISEEEAQEVLEYLKYTRDAYLNYYSKQ